MKALYLALALLVVAEPPKVERVKIPVHPQDLQICAAYVSQGAPRDVQWSCKDASEIREWILVNCRPTEQCEEWK
jgi:hypothetical protein